MRTLVNDEKVTLNKIHIGKSSDNSFFRTFPNFDVNFASQKEFIHLFCWGKDEDEKNILT